MANNELAAGERRREAHGECADVIVSVRSAESVRPWRAPSTFANDSLAMGLEETSGSVAVELVDTRLKGTVPLEMILQDGQNVALEDRVERQGEMRGLELMRSTVRLVVHKLFLRPNGEGSPAA